MGEVLRSDCNIARISGRWSKFRHRFGRRGKQRPASSGFKFGENVTHARKMVIERTHAACVNVSFGFVQVGLGPIKIADGVEALGGERCRH
jgi:hypothetical protein